MKKAILIGSLLCVLTSAPVYAQVSGQIVLEFPQGNDWRRHDNNDRYWRQERMNHEVRDRDNEERRRQEYYENSKARHDNGCGKNNAACHPNNGHNMSKKGRH